MADAATAPYAQATAVVNADGTVVRSQNVTEVKKVGSGEYRITVSEDVRWTVRSRSPRSTARRTGVARSL